LARSCATIFSSDTVQSRRAGDKMAR
jgi:hypothetical protein